MLDAPDLSAVGPLGYLVANGQAAMLPRLKQLLQVEAFSTSKSA